MTFDELVSRCKAGVNLDVNEHRNYYESVKERLENFDDEIEPTLREGMILADTMYRLQFYPDTPVGFYVVYGLTLEACLQRAEKCLEP